MIININTKEIVFNMMNISHMEVANIPEAEARYLVEAGTEKMEEIQRCIMDAEANMRLDMDRFLSRQENVPESEENTNPAPFPEKFEYSIVDSPRRFKFRENTIVKLMQTAIVENALGSFYGSVGAAELADKHNTLAEAGMLNLRKAFYSKNAPAEPERSEYGN